jgi:beta-lactamase family protein
MPRVRWLIAAVLAAAGPLTLSGCGGDDQTPPPAQEAVAKPVTPPPLPTHTPSPNTELPTADTTDAATPTATARPRRASTAILSSADKASFARLAASLGGTSGIAVSGVGFGRTVEQAGSLRSGVAWSTSKVPVAMAVIAAGAGPAHSQDLTQAITASDNAAAERLWAALGGGSTAAQAADAQLREAGDQETQIESRALNGPGYTPFGQTLWSLANQARFTAGLACTPPGAEVLRLMGRVVARQRWGLGSTGANAQFKAGWGPGAEPGVQGGYLDRQMGVINLSGKPLAVAIATRAHDGSHETATRNLTAIARWLTLHASARNLPGRLRC